MKVIIRKLLSMLDIAVFRQSALDRLNVELRQVKDQRAYDLNFLSAMPEEHLRRILALLPRSHSQLRQDIFVLSASNFQADGFFVEFGATDGVSLSNTCLLEREFGWKGILAEPARMWHKDLEVNRNAFIDHRCVWRSSGAEIQFKETSVGELSTIDAFSSADGHAAARSQGRVYSVETVSLNDLLLAYGAPELIDYLSIDTEGSEYEILAEMDWSRYKFRAITCEHNFTENRKAIYDLLTNHGYRRVYESISAFDDWYVLK